MKFFFPDSQDLVDPSFDFVNETRNETRIRQRDDCYAHEVFQKPPYDGMLVSKAIVEGTGGSVGRYTLSQQRRFISEGVREFMRLPKDLKVMGDCGAFTYVKEREPPVSVEDVSRFYDECGFDYGVSIDHIILEYKPGWDYSLPGIDPVPDECQRRQEITIQLAREFLKHCRKQKYRFEPIGVAQGWSPKSYSRAFSALQKMGYQYVALGGMVSLKSYEIMQVLEAVSPKLKPTTRLHLFGVTRLDHVNRFASHGVVSFDSTSPLRQAFKEDRDNYYSKDRTYVAIRVPQVDVNTRLRNRILSGEVEQAAAFRLERECLEALQQFDRRRFPRKDLVQLLAEYQDLFGGMRNYSADYEELLRDRPWKDCRCSICQQLGINVVIFRGAERYRRRGFHNAYVTHNRLKRIRRRTAVA
jgi:queuine/archaeosine tRNA-ribosyltransferase